ncbi:TPA: DNA cytosine methyltransferase, partial [Streptococcus suis]
NDSILKRYSNSHLNEKNKKYGFIEEDKEHPYFIINYISELIKEELDIHINENIDVSETKLSELKQAMPLSQIMSLYIVPIIIYGK